MLGVSGDAMTNSAGWVITAELVPVPRYRYDGTRLDVLSLFGSGVLVHKTLISC